MVWSENGHSYEVILSDSITFDDARLGAQSSGEGWDLVSITSQEEQKFINTLLPGNPSDRDHFLIGGLYVSGEWTWVDGEDWSYENWFPGEPNLLPGDIQLALNFRNTSGSWQWNNLVSSEYPDLVRGYIAEYSAVPEPSILALFTVGLAGFGLQRKNRARS